MPERRDVGVTVNGTRYEASVEPRLTLADFLRGELKLTGTHLGCEHGVCGACTVLLDGEAVRSCLLLAVQASGHEVTTVEGIAPAPGELHAVQRAFAQHHALQCGFCTPGLLATLVDFLAANPDPTRADVTEAVSGNICRCTGYAGIVEAALTAARELRGAGQAGDGRP